MTITALLVLVPGGQALAAARCLYVSSYHQGYEWNDGIERGLEPALAGRCELDRFYMDTKRHPGREYAEKVAAEAKRHIDATHPDVVIACDDNASRYLVQPYLRETAMPVVFCGVNRTATTYGYPYANATGMVEIPPARILLHVVQQAAAGVRHGIYIGPDILSQRKEYDHYQQISAEAGISLSHRFVHSPQEWASAFLASLNAGFVILGSNGGLEDWDRERMRELVYGNAKTLLVTNMDWMISYAMIGITKVAEEQGEWAAQAALAILDGLPVNRIPVVVNQRWNIYVNPSLLRRAGITLPPHILHKAVKVGK